MSSLNAVPGYTELNNQIEALLAQNSTLAEQESAALASGNIQAAESYRNQSAELVNQIADLQAQRQTLVQDYVTSGQNLASPTVTTDQSQSTPPANARDDGFAQSPTQGGVGAGTSTNAYNSVNSDDNPVPTRSSTQATINTSTASLNKLIPTQPNQLDQYASYTYSIGWYVLSPQQYNAMVDSQRPTVSGWQLLMQSGGAPVRGRSPAFSLDYYMDDLEIESLIPFGGTNMANSATNLRFKVTEPNGITLIESLFRAVVNVYKNAQQSQTNTTNNGAATATTPTTNETPNYLNAHYCLVIQFYGYDSKGNLVAPAKGAFSTNAATGGYGQQAVIIKYYPFRLIDIKFQIANRAIEYQVTGKSIPQSYANTTDRGTVPFPFTMTGQTVDQLLNGSPVGSATAANQADPGARQTSPTNPAASINDITASAGVDELGNFTGETGSPFTVVAP
jgi:hypothetical protein